MMGVREEYYTRKSRFIIILFLLFIILAFTLALSLTTGSTGFSFTNPLSLMFKVVKGGHLTPDERVQLYIRIPRTLTALAVGALLAVSGVLIQSITRNPLAEPFLLGLSSGALVFVCLSVLVTPVILCYRYLLALTAFTGAMIALVLTFIISEIAGATVTSLILAGIAVTSLFSGLSHILTFLVQMKLNRPFMILLLGSFSTSMLSDIPLLYTVLFLGFTMAMLMAKRLNAIMFGDEHSLQLGYNPTTTRRLSVILVSFMTGTTVAIAGIIGFIGLVIPHISRLIIGSDNRFVIVYSALIGAIVLCLTDVAVRVLSLLYGVGELPVGAITSMFGAPFFIYLVVSRLRGRV
ncbi:MAG TPA: iron ABC transporter permease [Desulfurococcales archaeon]|nr:iron ABC transporter permease [Desulfurococcales archaeon]